MLVMDSDKKLICLIKDYGNRWAKTHCIGISADPNKTAELKSELLKMRIEFIEDKTPYYEINRLVFRVFV